MAREAPIFEKRNILVTGGAGFIGSHLCDALVGDARVICMDNFSTSQVANIEHLLQNPDFEFINHDITQPFDLEAYDELERFHIKFQGIQEIYHLACPISKLYFENFKIATILTNSIGMKNVLDTAVKYKSKILYASSSALYGPRRNGQMSVSESDECHIDHLTDHGAYDEGKRFSESILFTYGNVYGLDVKITRLFRAYGPRAKIFDGNLLPDMINHALENKDIVLPTAEDVRMGLCYVSDAVDGMLRYMNSPVDVTLLNIGSDQEHFLSGIAGSIVQLCGSSSKVKFDTTMAYGTREAPLPDITKAKQLLGWIPLVRLDDGLRKMIDYARSQRQQRSSF